MADTNASDCAVRLLNLAPQLMQTLRVEMRAGRPPELTVPQFRALVFFDMHPGGSLSEAAEHLGLGLSSASKIVEGLVARRLLSRAASETDRRRVVIALTAAGGALLENARSQAAEVFSRRLSQLTGLELAVVDSVLAALQGLFGPGRADAAGGGVRVGRGAPPAS
jgi:DNA-binding MarR family transcriptional regulator